MSVPWSSNSAAAVRAVRGLPALPPPIGAAANLEITTAINKEINSDERLMNLRPRILEIANLYLSRGFSVFITIRQTIHFIRILRTTKPTNIEAAFNTAKSAAKLMKNGAARRTRRKGRRSTRRCH
jgi:hypothetical protein